MSKKIFLFSLLLSVCACTADDTELIDVKVNHFKRTAIGFYPQTTLLIQTDGKENSQEWNISYDPIEGFDYEWGYVYDLVIEQESIENPPEDASSLSWKLKEIVSKTAVDANTSFEIDLRWPLTRGGELFVQGDAPSGFTLLNDIAIDCVGLCAQLEDLVNNSEQGIVGVFRHQSTDRIELIELKVE